jgi:hypothetical protein
MALGVKTKIMELPIVKNYKSQSVKYPFLWASFGLG